MHRRTTRWWPALAAAVCAVGLAGADAWAEGPGPEATDPAAPTDPATPTEPEPSDEPGTGEPDETRQPTLRPIEPPRPGEEAASRGEPDPAKAWEGFPEAARKVGQQLEERYGKPDAVTEDVVVWNDNGPWVRTIVYKEATRHDFPRPHDEFVEQTVEYRVPVDMIDDLARFNGSLRVDRTRGELTVRSDDEAKNFLAVNLAHDIVTDQRTVEQARQFYAQTAAMLEQGQTDNPYVSGLRFSNAGDTADPGEQLSPSM